MVCIYCGSDTRVANSRSSKRINAVWRRRRCKKCDSTFTTFEETDLAGAIMIQKADGSLLPFKKIILLTSIYDCCKHRDESSNAAEDLTNTIINQLTSRRQAVFTRTELITAVINVLRRFDNAAAVQYQAFHHIEEK